MILSVSITKSELLISSRAKFLSSPIIRSSDAAEVFMISAPNGRYALPFDSTAASYICVIAKISAADDGVFHKRPALQGEYPHILTVKHNFTCRIAVGQQIVKIAVRK